MLKIAVITLFPEMFAPFLTMGVCSKAFKNEQVALTCINPRDFTEDKHRTVDDRPFGGGPGMVMKYEPLAKVIQHLRADGFERASVIYLSPQGEVFTQALAEKSSQSGELILLCGRYEGIDERFIEDYVDAEWSVGDYVLSGGELGAMVVMDAMIRLLPNVLGHELSAVEDSFSQNDANQRLLDHPHYTRPETIDGRTVPDVLLSGNHARIAEWRLQQRLQRTKQRRPDLLTGILKRDDDD